MKNKQLEITVQDLDHLGIVAGIVDEIGIVETINQHLGIDKRERISAGQVVKAMILNGLGLVSAPLYLFSQYFEGKADVPLYLSVADGNQADKAVFASLMREFRTQWSFETLKLLVADSALYSEDNLLCLEKLSWVTRVPATLKEAKQTSYSNTNQPRRTLCVSD
jgi:transposase